MVRYICYFIYLSIASCSNFNPNDDTVFFNGSDTLKPAFEILDSECNQVSKGFFSKCGYKISNYFEVVNEVAFDINADSVADSIVIISPKSLLLPSVFPFCKNEKEDDRILLVKIGDFRANYKKVIRNEIGVATIGVEQIEKSDSGFNLTYRKGQSCFFAYEVSLKFYNNKLFIDTIKASAGCPEDKRRDSLLHFSKSEFPLESFRRSKIDSIENVLIQKL